MFFLVACTSFPRDGPRPGTRAECVGWLMNSFGRTGVGWATVSENQVSKVAESSSSVSTHTTAEGALLLALAEAAAGVPVAGGFFRDSVGGFATNIADPILAYRLAALRLACPQFATTSPPHRTNVTCCCVCSSCAQVGTRVAASVRAS